MYSKCWFYVLDDEFLLGEAFELIHDRYMYIFLIYALKIYK